MAKRVIRAYCTVSREAACALAGTPPWELEAEVLAEVYHRTAAARRSGNPPARQEIEHWRKEARNAIIDKWSDQLEDPGAGHRTVLALQPVLRAWIERHRGSLPYRMVQVLTGHGCFGKYLHNIGRESTAGCHHCGSDTDTAQHTLEECPAWAGQRVALTAAIGLDLSLPTVVKTIVDNDTGFDAFKTFCESVMLEKEMAERAREEDPLADPIRRRRTGRRRRAFARNLI
ncbi:hypothetical protein ABMA28_009575 [Loxostege sticticalis]|uniref:Reverse transcriptase n=1 Tax=Loxostege sticticalis TaxID=481309 RepID=A0ABD0SDR6_LOXSC